MMSILLIGIFILTGCTGRTAPPQTYRFVGAFGAQTDITARTTDGAAFLQAVRQTEQGLTRMSALLSGPATGYELGLDAINRFAGQNAVAAAPEVLRYAQTLGLWRQRWPEDAGALPAVAVDLNYRTVTLAAGTSLPAGEVARGFALDDGAVQLQSLLQTQARQAAATALPTASPSPSAQATLGAPYRSAKPAALEGLLLQCGGGIRVAGTPPAGRGWPVAIDGANSSPTLWLKNGGACIRTRNQQPTLAWRALVVTAADAMTAALVSEQLCGLTIEQGRDLLRSRSIAAAAWVLDNGAVVREGSISLTR